MRRYWLQRGCLHVNTAAGIAAPQACADASAEQQNQYWHVCKTAPHFHVSSCTSGSVCSNSTQKLNLFAFLPRVTSPNSLAPPAAGATAAGASGSASNQGLLRRTTQPRQVRYHAGQVGGSYSHAGGASSGHQPLTHHPASRVLVAVTSRRHAACAWQGPRRQSGQRSSGFPGSTGGPCPGSGCVCTPALLGWQWPAPPAGCCATCVAVRRPPAKPWDA